MSAWLRILACHLTIPLFVAFSACAESDVSATFHDKSVAVLAQAVVESDLATIESSISGGVSPNAVGESNQFKITLLQFAMRKGAKRSFKKLLELGADPNLQNPGEGRGGTAVHLAAMSRDSEWLRLLLAAGGNPNVENRLSETPVFYALSTGSFANLDLLIEAGADLDHQNYDGDSIMLQQAQIRQWQDVIALLERGADWKLRNKSGAGLPELVASGQSGEPGIETDRQRVVGFLIQKGAKIPGSSG